MKVHEKLFAIEVKSGLKSEEARGLHKFSKFYPKAVCEVWNLERCVEFMEKGWKE